MRLTTERRRNRTRDDDAYLERLCAEYRPTMLSVACRRFGLPVTDAELLIQDVFVAFVESESEISDPRAWLMSATRDASRRYCQDTAPPAAPTEEAVPDVRTEMRRVLAHLSPRMRDVLRLHYFEGRSASEIAGELGTTRWYAERLIDAALSRARDVFQQINRVKA